MERSNSMAAVGDFQPLFFFNILIFGTLKHLYGDIRIKAAGHIGGFKLKNIITGITDSFNKIYGFPCLNPKIEAMLAGAFWSIKVGTSVRTEIP